MLLVSRRLERGRMLGLGLLLVCLLAAMWPATPSRAARLQQTSLRLDRMVTGVTDNRILVVAEPTSVAIEDQVAVTLAAGFGVDGAAGNVTTTTSGLPASFQGQSLTAWPGLSGTASSVAGQTVTFASGDLSLGTLYGFFITTGIDNPGSTGEYTHTVATRTLGGVLIDSSEATTAIIESDTVTLTGTVEPSAATVSSDFGIRVESESPQTAVPPDTVREYTIVYTNNSSDTKDIQLEAYWTMGNLEGSTLRTFEVVSYVPGSASVGHNNSTPIVDLDQRKVIWNIEGLPADGLERRVTFQLRTADSSLSANTVFYEIGGRIIDGSAVKLAEPLGQIYTPQPTTPTETPPSSPAASPPVATVRPPRETITPPEPVASPTPEIPLYVTKIAITDIDLDSFSLRVGTNVPTRTYILYGLTPDLGTPFAEENLAIEKNFTIGGLQPDTTYYFQLEVEDANGRRYRLPELFQVHTAREGLPEGVIRDEVLVSAQGTVLLRGVISNQIETVTVPLRTPLTVVIPFNEVQDMRVSASIVNPRVKGLRVPQELPFVGSAALSQTRPGIFSGELIAPELPGTFDLLVEVRDTESGVFYQLPLLHLRMSSPLLVTDQTGAPVEHARVQLERMSADNTFEPFEGGANGFAAPLFSGVDGLVEAVLPPGTYRVTVDAIGFARHQSTFTFDPRENEQYPQIHLERARWSLWSWIRYQVTTWQDTSQLTAWYLDELAESKRWRVSLVWLLAYVAGGQVLWLLIRVTKQQDYQGERRARHIPTFVRAWGRGLMMGGRLALVILLLAAVWAIMRGAGAQTVALAIVSGVNVLLLVAGRIQKYIQ